MRFLKRSLAVASGRSRESVTNHPWLVEARHGSKRHGATGLVKYQNFGYLATTHAHCILFEPGTTARPVRRVLVTGAASGIGLEAALQLAQRGDHLILADRNVAGGIAAVERITGNGGSAEFRELDLGDLARIRTFASDETARGLALDALINNAGLLPPKERAVTRDGFELVFGVAHLGHFALTGLLLPALLRSERPRVVSVSSLSHSGRRIDFDDLQFERHYTSSHAYSCAKLACLMFALELQRRAEAAGTALISAAAHPGISTTPIARGWQQEGRRKLHDRFELFAYNTATRLFGQTAAQGAQPLVYAATEAGVIGGGYYGPTGFKQLNGRPGRVQPAAHAFDTTVSARLWEESQRLTGVSIDALFEGRKLNPSATAANRSQ
jgi:NAD(P)-dependent dehydrogenase (short-subunit alcohol dehydrogenase family)